MEENKNVRVDSGVDIDIDDDSGMLAKTETDDVVDNTTAAAAAEVTLPTPLRPAVGAPPYACGWRDDEATMPLLLCDASATATESDEGEGAAGEETLSSEDAVSAVVLVGADASVADGGTAVEGAEGSAVCEGSTTEGGRED